MTSSLRREVVTVRTVHISLLGHTMVTPWVSLSLDSDTVTWAAGRPLSSVAFSHWFFLQWRHRRLLVSFVVMDDTFAVTDGTFAVTDGTFAVTAGTFAVTDSSVTSIFLLFLLIAASTFLGFLCLISSRFFASYSDGFYLCSDNWYLCSDDWYLCSDNWYICSGNWYSAVTIGTAAVRDSWYLCSDNWYLCSDDWYLCNDNWYLCSDCYQSLAFTCLPCGERR